MVITGASSGIGLIVARKAAAAGARVFLIARDAGTLARIAAAIIRQGGRAAYAAVDVADAGALARAAAEAVRVFGRIDCWVSNAGVAIYAPLLETPLDEHRRLFETNYFGAVNSAAAAMPHLAERGGTLIFTGSIAGDMPSPVMGAYSASKHALHGFVQSLAIELRAARSPVRVSLIKPSGVATPIAEHAANHRPGAARIPPPVYDPGLVADAILHAATHKVRARTVGGIGRLETLAAYALPGLFERLAPAIIPLLNERAHGRRGTGNLSRPGDNGRERATDERGRRASAYALAERLPATGLLLLGLAGAALILGRRAAR